MVDDIQTFTGESFVSKIGTRWVLLLCYRRSESYLRRRYQSTQSAPIISAIIVPPIIPILLDVIILSIRDTRPLLLTKDANATEKGFR